jgi:uncharacterized protein YutE (UPF0331/DUF86 family)/predicted nucleotidyltransferase
MGTKWGRAAVDTSQIYGEVSSWASSFAGLEALLLFGSYARKEETPLSDLDLAYLLEEGLSPFAEAEADKELYIGLSRFLGTDEITLINLAKAPLSIIFSALQEGKVLLCRCPERLLAFKEQVLILYPEVNRLRGEALAEFEMSLRGSPMNVEREKILYCLRLLKEEVTNLKEMAKLSQEEYLASNNAQIVAERRFQRAVENCLNIGNHIISRRELRLAEDYVSVFAILAEADIISRKLAGEMADMARFRNLLVHLYWRIDHESIYQQMSERIRVLESFAEEVYKSSVMSNE